MAAASGVLASVTRASAPPASAASSKTGSPMARASSRASLAWPSASRRSQSDSAVRASASRRRMRSADGWAGSSPSARCRRRRASSLRPSHHSALASATVSARRCSREAEPNASSSVSCAATASPAAACASASSACILVRRSLCSGPSGSRRNAAAWKWAAVPGAEDCSSRAAPASSVIACSSPARAACSTWCARATTPAPSRASARAARSCPPRRQPPGVAT